MHFRINFLQISHGSDQTDGTIRSNHASSQNKEGWRLTV